VAKGGGHRLRERLERKKKTIQDTDKPDTEEVKPGDVGAGKGEGKDGLQSLFTYTGVVERRKERGDVETRTRKPDGESGGQQFAGIMNLWKHRRPGRGGETAPTGVWIKRRKRDKRLSGEKPIFVDTRWGGPRRGVARNIESNTLAHTSPYSHEEDRMVRGTLSREIKERVKGEEWGKTYKIAPSR